MLAEYDRIRNIHKWENKVKLKASHKLVSMHAMYVCVCVCMCVCVYISDLYSLNLSSRMYISAV